MDPEIHFAHRIGWPARGCHVDGRELAEFTKAEVLILRSPNQSLSSSWSTMHSPPTREMNSGSPTNEAHGRAMGATAIIGAIFGTVG